jgi:hypothetical protein
LTTKAKNLHIFDPRNESTAMDTVCHESAKQSRLIWLGNNQDLMTVGFNVGNEREAKFWDVRNFGQPVKTQLIAHDNGVPTLHFDHQHKLIYVSSKGQCYIDAYGYCPDKQTPLMDGFQYKGQGTQKAFCVLPKRVVDVSKNEVTRSVRVTANELEYISFRIPFKGAPGKDYYPDCFQGQPSNTMEAWLKGSNVEPKFQDHDVSNASANQAKLV